MDPKDSFKEIVAEITKQISNGEAEKLLETFRQRIFEGADLSFFNYIWAYQQFMYRFDEAGIPKDKWPRGLGLTAGKRKWQKHLGCDWKQTCKIEDYEPGTNAIPREILQEGGLFIKAPTFAYFDKDGNRVSDKVATEWKNGRKVAKPGYEKRLAAFIDVKTVPEEMMQVKNEEKWRKNAPISMADVFSDVDLSETIEKLKQFATNKGLTIKYEAGIGLEGGSIDSTGIIRINPKINATAQCMILVHEIMHHLFGHLHDEEKQRQKKEAEAQLSAAMVMYVLGIEEAAIEKTSAYMKSYGAKPYEIMGIMNECSRKAEELLNAIQ